MGGLMAISLAFGRDQLEDGTTSQGYARAMDLGGELCKRFEAALGSTQCRDIQRSLFGRSFVCVTLVSDRSSERQAATTNAPRSPSGQQSSLLGSS